MNAAKKGLLLGLCLLLTVLGAGCGQGDKGELPESQNAKMFANPKKFIGYEATLTGQVLSVPRQVTQEGRTVYGFRLLCEAGGDEYQAVVYADEATVERFDKVTVVGTVYNSEEAETEEGQVLLPMLYPSQVTVTDEGYRTAQLEADHEALVAKQQELAGQAAEIKAKLDAGETVDAAVTKALDGEKKKYDTMKQDYDERMKRIEYLGDK